MKQMVVEDLKKMFFIIVLDNVLEKLEGMHNNEMPHNSGDKENLV